MQQNYDPPVGLNHQKPDITSGKTTRSAYRYDINGLRAVAVIAVIVNHFNRDILPLGYLGVDLFFLISGFVITSSISGKKSSIGIAKFWTDFYVRRFKRLYPALAACILVTSILICCFDSYPIASLRTGFAAIFGVSNLYLFKQATDYFGAWAELNVFTHTWSLGVEEQFYLIFPLVVYATSLRRDAEVFPKLFFWVVALASAASLVFYVFSFATNESLAFFTLPARL